uniref:Actin-related protein 6 n=1 Tax=Leptobrachium leishanense TaxID=445787 RepID=A0A8C5MZ01_9ANUR
MGKRRLPMLSYPTMHRREQRRSGTRRTIEHCDASSPQELFGVTEKMTTLVLDNGAYTAKLGYNDGEASVIPNCQFRSKTARLKTFTANQIDEVKDPSGLFYILPYQKGYLVNWDVQRQVWDYLFGKEMFQVDFLDTNVIITEPYFNFSSIQESMNEILFEEYQFQAALRINAGALSAHRYFRDHPSELCCIIVDSGYSFTHVVPYCRSRKKTEGIIRINVGGKVLTNHLKEIISYRQLHVMDETHVINQVKEDVCYVSTDFYKDMETAKLKGEDNTVMVDYVLPDFSTIKKGYIKKCSLISSKILFLLEEIPFFLGSGSGCMRRFVSSHQQTTTFQCFYHRSEYCILMLHIQIWKCFYRIWECTKRKNCILHTDNPSFSSSNPFLQGDECDIKSRKSRKIKLYNGSLPKVFDFLNMCDFSRQLSSWLGTIIACLSYRHSDLLMR